MQSRPSRQPRQSRSQPRSWLTVCLSVGVASACGTDLDPPAQTDGQGDVGPAGASVPGAPVDAPIRPLAQRAYVKAGNTGAYDSFGSSAVWSQTDYVKASNPGANHLFGASLALSADGVTLAVGATQESSAATGIDGDQSDASATFAGAVYVLDRRR